MLFDKSFIPQNTPERLYDLLKMIQVHSYDKEELKQLITPSGLNKTLDEFDIVFNAALNSNLIKIDDLKNKIQCLVDKEDLASMADFRRYMAKLAFNDERNLFNQFTTWYLSQNENVFYYKTATDLSNKLTGEFVDMDKKLVLGWRFWASFLGFGFIHDTFLIPNMSVRIQDTLYSIKALELDTELTFSEFMDFLQNQCPEIKSSIDDRKLSVALSNGLRTLNDSDKIKLINTPDSDDVWQLHRAESHEFSEHITGIILKEGLYE